MKHLFLLATLGLTACSNHTAQNAPQSTAKSGSGSNKLFNVPFWGLEDIWGDLAPNEQKQLKLLRDTPSANWLGEWNEDISQDVKTLTEMAPDDEYLAIVPYNVPNRDCGQHSSGGLKTQKSYVSWVDRITQALGEQKTIVILEPDALSLVDCVDREHRFQSLALAVKKLKQKKNITVYIDAAHARWPFADSESQAYKEAALRLKKAGIADADGFALNTSNYVSTSENKAHGKGVLQALTEMGIDGKGFIIDSSRNGNGPTQDSQWCNPRGRAVGDLPYWSNAKPGFHGTLWVKRPGESDGTCNGGPAAGEFWKDIALELVQNAK